VPLQRRTTKQEDIPAGRKNRGGVCRDVKEVRSPLPDEKTFKMIFAGNAKTARKNLDRFAPRADNVQ
jgi:hypothetical protein